MKQQNREKQIIRTSFVGIAGNILLVGFKAAVGFLAGSVAIIMDALNNLTDALSSVITIVGTKLSAKRPDKKHPYGYGRIEYITSTLIAILILVAGGTAIYESVKSIIDHFQNGTLPEFEITSLIIIGVAVLFKVALGLFFKRQAKKTESDALDASGSDALFDSILSTATLIGAFVAKFAGFYVEGYLGILIGAFILKSGFSALLESLSGMIGNRFDKEFVQTIKKEILEVEGVHGVYDLILNGYGHEKNIGSVHIGVDSKLTAGEIQGIERAITELCYFKHHTIMTVGIYAENPDDEETKAAQSTVSSILSSYPTVLQLHGLYLNKAKSLLNFDLVISFDDKEPEATIESIKNAVEKALPMYQVYIQYDKDFSLT